MKQRNEFVQKNKLCTFQLKHRLAKTQKKHKNSRTYIPLIYVERDSYVFNLFREDKIKRTDKCGFGVGMTSSKRGQPLHEYHVSTSICSVSQRVMTRHWRHSVVATCRFHGRLKSKMFSIFVWNLRLQHIGICVCSELRQIIIINENVLDYSYAWLPNGIWLSARAICNLFFIFFFVCPKRTRNRYPYTRTTW